MTIEPHDNVLKKYTAKAEGSIEAYRKNPSAENLKKMIGSLEDLKHANPTHLNGGIYAGTRNAFSRGEEMSGRGNTLRGSLNKYVGAPIKAVGETVAAPVNALARALHPDKNFAFRTPENMEEERSDDPVTNLRAANELLELYKTKRIDPTVQGELTRRIVQQVGPNTERAGAALAMSALDPASLLGFLGNIAVGDILSAPHTAIMNAYGWNGSPRSQYEAAERAKVGITEKAAAAKKALWQKAAAAIAMR